MVKVLRSANKVNANIFVCWTPKRVFNGYEDTNVVLVVVIVEVLVVIRFSNY